MFRTGTLVRGCVQVLDVGDYGAHGPPRWYGRMFAGYKAGKDSFRIFDLNYPETTRKICILRAGKVIKHIYSLLTPVVPERTQTKIAIFGNDANEWAELLGSELGPSSSLPDFLTDNRPQSFAKASPPGGIVPFGGVVDEAILEAAKQCKYRAQYTSPKARAATASASFFMGDENDSASSVLACRPALLPRDATPKESQNKTRNWLKPLSCTACALPLLALALLSGGASALAVLDLRSIPEIA